jgi:hypothetical protein
MTPHVIRQERGKVRVGADDSRGTQDRVSEDRRLGFVQVAKELRSGRVGKQETERREWTVDEVLQSK